jgi:hypothetical protein
MWFPSKDSTGRLLWRKKANFEALKKRRPFSLILSQKLFEHV